MRELAATPALSAITKSELEPGSSLTSDEQLLDDFRERSGTVFHPIGTARWVRMQAMLSLIQH